MYDEALMLDVINFKKGYCRIQDLEYNKENILKIIKNRTKDKMYFLKCLLTYNVINKELYAELVSRVEYDYKISTLYIMNLITEI